MSILDEIERWARSELETRNAAREQALSKSRELTRTCANTIRAVHRRDYEQARTLLAAAKVLSDGLTQNLAPYPDLFYAATSGRAEGVRRGERDSQPDRGTPMPPPEIGVAAAVPQRAAAEAASFGEFVWTSCGAARSRAARRCSR
jgi:translin